MNCIGTFKRRSRAFRLVQTSALFLVVGFGLTACSQKPLDREITEVRKGSVRPDSKPGGGNAGGMASNQGGSSGPDFVWVTPEGWMELPPTQMRVANFQVGGDPSAECYLTILPGMGGGLVDNVNRWRSQIGLGPQSAEEIAALPKRSLFGNPATILELEGAYKGMGDQAVEGSGLVGAILTMKEGMLFVKMTGPLDVIRANRAQFDVFCDSLDINTGEEHDHSSHAPGAHGEEPPAASANSSGGLSWTPPEGWGELPTKSMRVVSYSVGKSGKSECYVSVLGGNGGGLEMNVNRWRTQVGAEELDDAELNALPKLSILGVESPWVEAYGDFSGMGAEDMSNAGILGAICILGSQTLFVKMVGDAAELRDERQNFISFCESLRAE